MGSDFYCYNSSIKGQGGVIVLNRLKNDLLNSPSVKKCRIVGLTGERIKQFLDDVHDYGVLTKPVVFASLRYERWLDLNPKATLNAKASMLKELYKDYDLDNLLNEYPETRVRFFMMTCFKTKNLKLNKEFQFIIKDLRNQKLSPWDIQKRLQNSRNDTLEKMKNFS